MAMRRGSAPAVGETRAWISTNRGRVPSTMGVTMEPGAVDVRSWVRAAEGSATSRRAGFGHLEDGDLIRGAKAVLGAASDAIGAQGLRLRDRGQHRTACSRTRGPAIAPSFVTWPDMMTETPRRRAHSTSLAPHSRTCATLPADDDASVLRVWMEINEEQVWRIVVEVREESVHVRFGDHRHTIAGQGPDGRRGGRSVPVIPLRPRRRCSSRLSRLRKAS